MIERNEPKQPRRQPVNRRLSWHVVHTPSEPRRRVTRISLRISPSHRLLISLRKFRTNKALRSKRYKQVVTKTYFLPIREIAITHKRYRLAPNSRHLRKKKRRMPVLLWGARQAVPVAIVGLGIGGILYFGSHLYKPLGLSTVVANSIPTPAVSGPVRHQPSGGLPYSEPTRLRISHLGIDTPLVSLGRNPDGTMQVPSRYDIAGWYKNAPTPGEIGPAIIAGHVDSWQGPAIFWSISELQAGNIFEVDRADGDTIKFRVDSVKQFPQNDFPTQDVYGDISHSGIRLITCGGVFDRQAQRYSHNTVVYGSLVTEEEKREVAPLRPIEEYLKINNSWLSS